MKKFEYIIIFLLLLILVEVGMVGFQLIDILENQRYLIEMIDVIYDGFS